SGNNNYENYKSGLENENEKQVLNISKEFDLWKKVNRFFNKYTLSKSFAIENAEKIILL
ncbi:19340_t:CDS:1, partial [Rhizophagus irregularis]